MTAPADSNRVTRGKTVVPAVHESPFADADARVFVTVAEARSFAAAAVRLRITPSAVSKAIARLEGALGVKLLVRTTRALHLTDEGLVFCERCERAFTLLSEAVEEVSHGAQALAGTIRIGLPPLFGTYFLPRVLAQLVAEHPALRVEIVSTMRASDLVDRRLDLAIVVGPLPDSSFVSRPLGFGQFVTVAAPSYLARMGTPKDPADLATHACLGYVRPDGRDAPFLFGAEEAPEPVRVTGPVRSDDMHHLAALAVAGLGVAQLPYFAVARDLEMQALVRILERHEPEPKLASVVFPAGRIIPRRVRVLADRLVSPSSEMPGTSAKRTRPRTMAE